MDWTPASHPSCEGDAPAFRTGSAGEAALQRLDVLDVALGVVVQAARADGPEALVVARDRGGLVAAGLVEQLLEVQHACADVVRRRVRVERLRGQVLLDPVPRPGH